MTPHYEVFRGTDQRWYWHLKAGNGEITSASEAYATKSDAVRGANDNSRVALGAAMEPVRILEAE